MMQDSGPSNPPSPPRFAERIFRVLFPDGGIFTTLGDLEEIFRNIAHEKGPRRARIWYWRQLFKAVPHRIAGFFCMDIPLFVLSLRIMARSLRKNKVFSFLNIFALTLGLSCFLLIYIYARYEFTYDSFHPGHRNIYRVRLQSSQENERPSPGFPLAPLLQSQVPDIALAAQFCNAFDPLIKIDGRLFESAGKFADDNFLKIFHFPFIRAIDSPLLKPFAVILTESSVERFFGSDDPMGKTMSFNIRGEPCEVTVTGILADPPRNTHFDFDLLISFSTTEALPRFLGLREAVSYGLTANYIKLHEETSVEDCAEKISGLLRSHSPEAASETGIGCDLQPITDIHLRPDNKDSSAVRSLTLYLTLGLIILVIACINYVNLATARSVIRMREIGIRKTIGAQRRQLMRQFIGEALFFTGISFFLSFVFLGFALPVFNRLLNKDIGLNLFFEGSLWLETLGIITIVGIASGIYPAVFLSSFKPVRILKGTVPSPEMIGFRPSRLRNALVVLQFTVSIVLICVMLFIQQQVHYIRTMDTGFDRNNIVEVFGLDNAVAVKNELLRNPKILGITMASNVVTLSSRKDTSEEFGDNIRYAPASSSPEEFRAHHVRCDSEFLDVFKIPPISGRNFSDTLNESTSVIVNETFARRLGPGNPIGKRIQVSSWLNDEEHWEDFFIVGMVKDFHHKPLTQTIKPFFLTHSSSSNTFVLYAKIQGEDIADTMAFIKKAVQEFNPDDLKPIGFLDERIREIYKTEENQSILLSAFSSLAALIACLGLFGLAAFTAEQKTKEIGIRKVLGAHTGQLFLMMFQDFGRLTVLAVAVGCPLGYYFVSRWMANFAYHIPILPWTFLLTGVLVLAAVILTSGTQIIRVSRVNPADILRHE